MAQNSQFSETPRRPIKKNGNKKPELPQNNNALFWIAIAFIFFILLSQSNTVQHIGAPRELTYSEFYSILADNPQTSKIQKLELIEGVDRSLKGTFNDGTDFTLSIPQEDEGLLSSIRTNVSNFKVTPPQTFWPVVGGRSGML